MKKLLTILFCLGALTLFSCEDSSDEEVFMEIETAIGGDFDSTSKSDIGGDFDSGK